MLNQWTSYIKHSAYITQNPTQPLSDISGVNLTSSGDTKCFFHISRSTRHINTTNLSNWWSYTLSRVQFHVFFCESNWVLTDIYGSCCYRLMPTSSTMSLPWCLTVVGEAHFAETLEQVLLYFIRCHKLGAKRTVEAWEDKNRKIRQWRPRCVKVSLITFYWYVHRIGRGTAGMGLTSHSHT